MARCITPQPPHKMEVPASVIKNTRSVLLSSMKGVPLKRFCRDYKSLVGEEFPWRKLGFCSAGSLLHSMTEVVRFEFSQKDGNYRLYGIADRMVYTPSWFVKAQGIDTLLPLHNSQAPSLFCISDLVSCPNLVSEMRERTEMWDKSSEISKL